MDSERKKKDLSWYKVRDTMLGRNFVVQDVTKALELAAVCGHPEARWLVDLFAGRSIESVEDARSVFFEQGDDEKAGYFCKSLQGNVIDSEYIQALQRSAELGYALAQAELALSLEISELSFSWAKKSAAQGEREGFFLLGYYYRVGEGCDMDLSKAKENYVLAAELGCVFAMQEYAKLLDESDSQRFVWLGKAAIQGCVTPFLDEFADRVKIFKHDVVFAIGHVLKGRFIEDTNEVFGFKVHVSDINSAKIAVGFYDAQLAASRLAVDAWSLVGLRRGIVKDIRILIGMIVWNARDEALYEVPQVTIICGEVERS